MIVLCVLNFPISTEKREKREKERDRARARQTGRAWSFIRQWHKHSTLDFYFIIFLIFPKIYFLFFHFSAHITVISSIASLVFRVSFSLFHPLQRGSHKIISSEAKTNIFICLLFYFSRFSFFNSLLWARFSNRRLRVWRLNVLVQGKP